MYAYDEQINGVSIKGDLTVGSGMRYKQHRLRFVFSTPAHWGTPAELVVYEDGSSEVNYSTGGVNDVSPEVLIQWMQELWTVVGRVLTSFKDRGFFARVVNNHLIEVERIRKAAQA